MVNNNPQNCFDMNTAVRDATEESGCLNYPLTNGIK